MQSHDNSRFIVLILEKEKRLEMEKKENDIIYSKAIKAGKRIYYLDVKKSRNDDLYLSITESKKRVMGSDDAQVSYEKHKIFLYKEDFSEFTEGLEDVISFIRTRKKEDTEKIFFLLTLVICIKLRISESLFDTM